MKIEQLISIDEKRNFLKWFIGQYELKAKECIWLLNFILNDDHIMSLVRFVASLDGCPRAMLISAKTAESIPFLYRKESVETKEPEKAFHDIRLNQEEPIYIQFAFENASKSAPYLSVLEDHPSHELNLEKRYGQEAEQILIQSEYQYKIDHLHQSIDKALMERDHSSFIRLTNQLIKFQKRLEEILGKRI